MENSQKIYVCNGTVEGLLSSVYESYYSEDYVYDIITEGYFQGNFAYDYKSIETDYDKAQKVAYAIKNKISRFTFDNIVKTWLSELPLRGHHLLKYIALGFDKGNDVNNMMTQDNVEFILKTTRKVDTEVHRFLGILRFSKMNDGTFFSEISPDHNILPLIAEHFANRLSCERLIICDQRRKSAILANHGEWILANDISIANPELSDDEYIFREMWQRYFEAVAIKERINKKLQRSFIPIRYWDNIIELKKS